MRKTKQKWFGVVRWCDEDIRNALSAHGYESSDETVAIIREQCEHHFFQDSMVEMGWNLIHSFIIGSEHRLSQFEERED